MGVCFKFVRASFCSFAGLLLAATSIGPAFGFITGSIMLRLYVDFDKFSKGEGRMGGGGAQTEAELAGTLRDMRSF